MMVAAMFALAPIFGLSMPMAYAGTHVHFAAFFATKGPGSVNYPDTVKGDDIEGPMMKQGAEMMLFAHSVSVKDGDILNLQNDTLRSKGAGGEFDDFGLNCQISMKVDDSMGVGGLCEIFVTRGKENHVIKPTPIKEQLVWYKVFEDKEQGVAGYFMKETGADMTEHK